MAIGCDISALLGDLDNGGQCVAVLSCGLNHVYPYRNVELAYKIVRSGGCLISEYLSHLKPQKYTFVKRNRLQNGVSQGVLVIEIDINGGTMYTANVTRRQCRRLGIYASYLLQNATGNLKLQDSRDTIVVDSEETIEDFIIHLLARDDNRQMNLFEYMQ